MIGELYVSAVQVAVITFIRITNMVRDVGDMGVNEFSLLFFFFFLLSVLLDRIAFLACALACVTTNQPPDLDDLATTHPPLRR